MEAPATSPERRARRIRGWLPGLSCLLLLALVLALVQKGVLRGERSFFTHGDNLHQSYPWAASVARSLEQGSFPLWDPWTQCGTSQVGEVQTGVFYPPGLLTAWLGPRTAWGALDVRSLELLVLLHYLLGGLGMFLLLRGLGMSWAAGVLGALVFAFAGSFATKANGQSNLFFAYAWVPLGLAAGLRAMRGRGRVYGDPWLYGLGLAGGMSLLAGHAAGLVFLLLALGGMVVLPPVLGSGKLGSGGKEGGRLGSRAGECGGRGSGAWEDRGLERGTRLPLPSQAKVRLSRVRAAQVLFLGGLLAFLIAGPQLTMGYEYLRDAHRAVGEGVAVRALKRVPFELYANKEVLHPGGLLGLVWPDVAIADGASLFLGWTGLVLALLGAVFGGRRARLPLALLLFSLLVALGGHTPLARLFHRLPGIGMVREPVRFLFLFSLAGAWLGGLGLQWMGKRLPPRIARPLTGLLLLSLALELGWAGARLSAPRRGDPVAAAYAEHPMVRALLALPKGERALHRVLIQEECLTPNLALVRPLLSVLGHRATRQDSFSALIGEARGLQDPIWDDLAVRWVVAREELPEFLVLGRAGGLVLHERGSSASLLHWAASRRAAGLRSFEMRPGEVDLVLRPHSGGTLLLAQPVYPGWRAEVEGRPRPLVQERGLMGIPLKPGEAKVRFVYRPLTLLLGLGLWGLFGFLFLGACLLPRLGFGKGRG